MESLALWLWLVYGLLAFVFRVAIQLHRTGETGLRGVTGKPGSVEWLAGAGTIGSIALGVAAPILAQADAVEAVGALDTTPVHVAGIALYAVGLTGVVIAQLAMGRSWRIGVDENERTALVTAGPFSIVRNPIFSAMAAVSIGLALLVPSILSLAAAALLVASLELQTRVVEEPYLLRAHGESYAAYASRVGRFLPGVGRIAARR